MRTIVAVKTGEAEYCRLGRQSAKAFQLALRVSYNLEARPLTETIALTLAPKCLSKQKDGGSRERDSFLSAREACGSSKGEKLWRPCEC